MAAGQLVFALLCFFLQPRIAISALGPTLDAEIAKHHASIEEHWNRLAGLLQELRSAGAVSMSPTSAVPSPGELEKKSVSRACLDVIQQREADFTALQADAFEIGRESQDNDELARHPKVNSYLQRLREFHPKIQDALSLLEGEYSRVLGQAPKKPKKQKKQATEIFCGRSEAQLHASAKEAAAQDQRQFRTKAMDIASMFRERQLQMQDKQRDLQMQMEGPDWPKEDWPLSTADAKRIGAAEEAMQAGLKDLNSRLDVVGGLARVHDSEDETALELLRLLSDMMECYSDLIDKHVASVKRAYTGKRKRKSKASQKSTSSGVLGPSMQKSLLDFGSKTASPFAWLRDEAQPSASAAPPVQAAESRHPSLGQTFGSLQGLQAQDFGTAGIANLGQVGSSLGALSGSASGGLPPLRSAEPQKQREWTAAQPVYSNGEL